MGCFEDCNKTVDFIKGSKLQKLKPAEMACCYEVQAYVCVYGSLS
jgi:hypothetical protein